MTEAEQKLGMPQRRQQLIYRIGGLTTFLANNVRQIEAHHIEHVLASVSLRIKNPIFWRSSLFLRTVFSRGSAADCSPQMAVWVEGTHYTLDLAL